MQDCDTYNKGITLITQFHGNKKRATNSALWELGKIQMLPLCDSKFFCFFNFLYLLLHLDVLNYPFDLKKCET